MKRAMLRYIMIAAAAAVLSLPALAPPASAHNIIHWLGKAGYGAALGDTPHDEVQACDKSADGLDIQVQYRGQSNGTVRDRNGSGGTCGEIQVRPITSFRVCATQSLVVIQCTQWFAA